MADHGGAAGERLKSGVITLAEHGSAPKILPSANDIVADFRTHDANEEVLAQAYRRGLRVAFGHRRVRKTLEFLFGR